MSTVKYYFEHEGEYREILLRRADDSISVLMGDSETVFKTRGMGSKAEMALEGNPFRQCAVTSTKEGFWVTVGGETVFLPLTRTKPRKKAQGSGGTPTSPMPGVVVRVEVHAEQRVEEGDPLVVVEAMKMEHVIRASCDGIVTNVLVGAGDRVDGGQELVQLEKAESE